ncbi:MAG: TatD family hydrolase [Chloroflexi bacterium]|nr:TatD family hydrolase [Chloroflexota bacterium]
MFSLTDTHCHLDFKNFDADRNEVLSRAIAAGVTRIVNPGIDLATSRNAIHLANTLPGVYAAVGVHPNDAAGWNGATPDELRIIIQSPRVCAVGEIGLDYYRDRTPRAIQIEILSRQLEIAAEAGLPVILHSRQSIRDLLAVLEQWQSGLAADRSPLAERPGILHAFEGNLDDAFRAQSYNFLIGVGGPVTFSNANERREIIKAIAIERIVLETDAPFLTPHPFRGQRNEPANIRLIAEQISLLKNIPLSIVAEQTTNNAEIIFGWRNTD